MHRWRHVYKYALTALGLLVAPLALPAQILPGPADAGRVRPEALPQTPGMPQPVEVAPTAIPAQAVPMEAKKVRFILRKVHFRKMTAFSEAELAPIYAPYMGKEITLDQVWYMAGQLTERYRAAGYFLSRAFVPQQHIRNGEITLEAVEGYIGIVEGAVELQEYSVIREAIAEIYTERPVTLPTLEGLLLRLNAIPGFSFRAVLTEWKDGERGAVKLVLTPSEKRNQGSVSFDNSGSRFLGPHLVTLAYRANLLPMQETSISLSASLPADELQYAYLEHRIALTSRLSLVLDGSISHAEPGYTLEQFDIKSRAYSLGVGFDYALVKERAQTLDLGLYLDGRNAVSEQLNNTLSDDRVRALRWHADYGGSDSWNGNNQARFILSQGLDILGGSEADEPNLSRAEAKPDFRKAELTLARAQGITQNWSLFGSVYGQYASGPLYSSEEAGYGGRLYGRGYDSSEITGDHGLMGVVEVRYGGFGQLEPVGLLPYAFYDAGKVWNEDLGSPSSAAGSSAGIGVRLFSPYQLSGELGLAVPLTRPAESPIYGNNGKQPRLLFQISHSF